MTKSGADSQAEVSAELTADTPASPAPAAAGDPSPSTEIRPEPTPAERVEAIIVVEDVLDVRRRKADRATRGTLAALLCLEALVILLVPRAIAQTSTGIDASKATLLITLAVVLVGTGFALRQKWGVGLGSFLQILVLLTGIWVWVMFFIAAIFIGIWLWVLTMRRDLVGTPGGFKMLSS
jgi:hypothetical protein